VHTVSQKGEVSPIVKCTRTTCGFNARITLEKWNKKPLYGVAIERFVNGVWVAEMHHTHALSEAEARANCSHLGGEYRIVSAAPAIGFFVDAKGNVSAD